MWNNSTEGKPVATQNIGDRDVLPYPERKCDILLHSEVFDASPNIAQSDMMGTF